MSYSQPEDGHYQSPNHVVVPYVENTLYSTNKYSCVRPVRILHNGYFIENSGVDEPRDYKMATFISLLYQINHLKPSGFFMYHQV